MAQRDENNPRDLIEDPRNRPEENRREYSESITSGPTERLMQVQQGPATNLFKLDPIRQYYIMRNKNPASDAIILDTQTDQYRPYMDGDSQPIQYKKISFGAIDWMASDNTRPLTYEAPGSSNINWSFLGYNSTEGNNATFSRENGTNTSPERDVRGEWSAALSGDPDPPENVNRSRNDNWGTVINKELPTPYTSAGDYNFASSLSNLAFESLPDRLPIEEEGAVLSRLGIASPNVINQIYLATGQTPTEFIQDNGIGAENFNALVAQTIIDGSPGILPPVKNMAALAAYPEEVFLRLSEEKYNLFYFNDFNTVAPLVKDIMTHKSSLFDASNTENSLNQGFLNPEYNFLNCEYEDAISNPAIPEAVLPNFYVYNFVGDAGRELGRPPWQDQNEEQRELQRNYDRLITFDEFSANTIPSMESEEFQDYLFQYATAVSEANITIDFISSLQRQFENITTPSADADIFDLLNRKKKFVPFYVEVGVPTVPQGPVGNYLQQNKLSSYLVNAIVTSEKENVLHTSNMNIRHQGFQKPSFINTQDEGDLIEEDPFALDGMIDQASISLGPGANKSSVLIYDWNEIFRRVQNMIISDSATLLSRDGEPPTPQEVRQYLNSMQSYILSQASEKVVGYDEYLKGKTSCEQETLVYELRKIKTDNNEILQKFFFPNSSLADTISFIDTQVKYDTGYTYELYAYGLVYGSEWRFRTRMTSELSFQAGIDGAPIYYSFNVESKPNLRIIKYPVLTRTYAERNLFGKKLGGVSYPEAVIKDRPPIEPLVTIVPYRNNYRQVLFNLSPMVGSYTGDRALKYIPITEEDSRLFYSISKNQKESENYGMKRGFAEFQNEGEKEIRSIEIYRTTELDEGASTADLFYRSFDGKKIKTLTVSNSTSVPESSRVNAYDFKDTIEPNVVYYYTFRTIDRHDQPSNPTAIYRVELVYDRGLYLPQISTFNPEPISRKKAQKRLTRFLEIKAADIQTFDYKQFDSDGSWIKTFKGLIDEGDDRVENNDFIIRLTSKDTGKKIQFRISFNEKVNTEEQAENDPECSTNDSQSPT